MRGYGTKLVWNSLRSTLSDPSKRNDAVMDETTVYTIVSIPHTAGETDDRTLSNETVQVLVVGALNAQVPATDIIGGLVVDHEAAIRVLKSCVCGENRVVWLND